MILTKKEKVFVPTTFIEQEKRE